MHCDNRLKRHEYISCSPIANCQLIPMLLGCRITYHLHPIALITVRKPRVQAAPTGETKRARFSGSFFGSVAREPRCGFPDPPPPSQDKLSLSHSLSSLNTHSPLLTGLPGELGRACRQAAPLALSLSPRDPSASPAQGRGVAAARGACTVLC